MDSNDTITLTRRQFETLQKLICGKLVEQHSLAKLPYSPATCAKIAIEAAPSDPATQKTLQDFLMGACG